MEDKVSDIVGKNCLGSCCWDLLAQTLGTEGHMAVVGEGPGGRS